MVHVLALSVVMILTRQTVKPFDLMNPLFAATSVARPQFPGIAANRAHRVQATPAQPQFSALKNSNPQMWTPFAGAYPFSAQRQQATPQVSTNCTGCRFSALA